MKQFDITGMSCAACSARVENAVSKLEGVSSCSVSLLTNSMGVEGSASDSQIIEAVTKAGYGASLKGGENNTASSKKKSSSEDPLKDRETPVLKKRLISSLFFLLPLMYISMGHSHWGWPLPSFLTANPICLGLSQLLLTAIVMVINQKFFRSGFKGLINRAPNMDTLVSLGATASFVYSCWALFAMANAQVSKGPQAALAYMHEFYFESAAMILTLITVGKMLEARSKGKTTDALKSLMKLAPQTAVIIQDGQEKTVAIDAVKKDDIFIVRPGENIPVDGIIIEGNTAINEAALTGESIPVDKTVNDEISAATTNVSGFIKCRATRVGEDTTLSQIIQLVSDAAATKAPIAKIADKVSGVFVPSVISISLITLIIWLATGAAPGIAIMHAVAVLVISCPCALGLATPVAIMVGNGMGAKNGILFKTALSLEQAGKITIAALDKTGTITSGKPVVTDIITAQESKISEEELLTAAYSLEVKSEHPLAKAIVEKAQAQKLEALATSKFEILPGNGLTALSEKDKKSLRGGNLAFIKKFASVSEESLQKAQTLAEEGKTPLFFAKDSKLLGIIAVADTIKEDSAQAIKELRNMGIKTVMLTGDNEKTARAIGKESGVDQVIAGVLPEEKAKAINELKKEGRVCMTGDGINDAPSLTSADLGIAIGAGSDVAIDAADIVLMKSSLKELPALIRLSRATVRNIHQNLFWAFIYNIIGIPLAAGAFVKLFGWHLNPMFGAAAMSLSSFCVVTNALRLNFFKLYSTKKDKKNKKTKNDGEIRLTQMEAKAMNTKTLSIEGMMCEHCEAHVKKALEAIPGITSAAPSHKAKEAVITLSSEVSEDAIKQAIVDAGYEYLGTK